jgi:hypothetical protein
MSPLPRHHHHVITATLSMPCLHCHITVMSPLSSHHRHVTTVKSPPPRHHHHVIFT